MQFKKFRSPDQFTRRLALLSGHVYLVGNEFQSLPEFAWKEAFSQGCLTEDMIVALQIDPSVVQGLSEQAGLKMKVREAVQDAIKHNRAEAFKKDGYPNAVWLSNKIGVRVSS